MTPRTTDSPSPPTVEEIRRIRAISNPVIRNLEITQCYSRLSVAMTERTGRCSNWCTYATWASRQAGRTIRGEDLIEMLQTRLHGRAGLLHPLASLGRALLRRGLFDPGTALGRLTAQLHTPFDAFELTSDAVARGNRKVFEEIGLEFARYLHDVPPDADVESTQLRAFVDQLRPGEPPDGQRYLEQAFTCYARCDSAEPDLGPRAELVLLANLEIGMHEQTRLQPEIRESLDAPYAVAVQHDLGRRLLQALFTTWGHRMPRMVAVGAGALGARAQRGVSDMVREIITRSLTVIALPGRVLALGSNLDEPFPELLRELHDTELIALVDRFEPVAPAPDDSGARDWSDFDQRMHYIVHFFRAFHLHEKLLDAPFTAEQLQKFTAGVIPDGAL
ncbi:MAG: hypothetical protein QOF69_2876 [Solirubrobacteraceae bacterium]|nr:hypothetical protein [Solirubrobacteraceae bacterium]